MAKIRYAQAISNVDAGSYKLSTTMMDAANNILLQSEPVDVVVPAQPDDATFDPPVVTVEP